MKDWPRTIDEAIQRYHRLEREGVAPSLQVRPTPGGMYVCSDRHSVHFVPECFYAMVVGFEAKLAATPRGAKAEGAAR